MKKTSEERKVPLVAQTSTIKTRTVGHLIQKYFKINRSDGMGTCLVSESTIITSQSNKVCVRSTLFRLSWFDDTLSKPSLNLNSDIKADQVLLSPDLAPVINIQSVKRNYLGKPYTDCVNTYSTNNYSYLYVENPPKIYSGENDFCLDSKKYDQILTLRLKLSKISDSNCIMNELMNIICHKCNCFPSYLNAVYDIKSKCQE